MDGRLSGLSGNRSRFISETQNWKITLPYDLSVNMSAATSLLQFFVEMVNYTRILLIIA